MERFTIFFRLCVLFALLILSTSSLAEVDLGQLSFGTYVTGPKISHEDLQNRIVVVEYWGVHCPPCIASIPHMSKVAEDFGSDKLAVIAIHKQGGSEDQVRQTWEARAKSEAVSVYNMGHLPGFNMRGIPAVIMFDHTGKQIWTGRPGGLDKPLGDAIKNLKQAQASARAKKKAENPDPIITDLKLKYFTREVKQINDQKGRVTRALEKFRRTIERSRRKDQVEEAKAIMQQLGAWAEKNTSQAQAARQNDPGLAFELAERTVALLGSDKLSADLLLMMSDMESDQATMAIIHSSKLLKETQSLALDIGLDGDASSVDQRRFGNQLKTITSNLQQLIENWPNTDAGKQAADLQKAWKLD